MTRLDLSATLRVRQDQSALASKYTAKGELNINFVDPSHVNAQIVTAGQGDVAQWTDCLSQMDVGVVC